MHAEWRFRVAIAALILIAVVRVASTHRVFSAVMDEPVHIVSGYEWLHGRYVHDATHPPLARILSALPLWNLPPPRTSDFVGAGNDLLYHGDRYEKILARARIGNLLLLILAIGAVAALARRGFSDRIAILAAAVFSSIPAVLGHAGLATTDLAVAATLPLSLLALDLFLEEPTPLRSTFLGVAVAMGALSKFSFFVFFPATMAVLIALRWPIRIRVGPLLLVLTTAFLIFWGGYRFHVGRPADVTRDAGFWVEHSLPGPTLQSFTRRLAKTPLPAPEFFLGFAMVKIHNRDGHAAFLFDQESQTGWWYYFPVVLFFKSPIPLLVLALWGCASILREKRRRDLEAILVALAIMAVAMTSRINIGLRHILPVYAPLAILAACGIAHAWNGSKRSRIAGVTLLSWLVIGAGFAHPDYMAWFNELAGRKPGKIAVDSNLDWGQDVLRLARVVRENQIQSLPLDIVTSARLLELGIPAVPLSDGDAPHCGLIAVSAMVLRIDEARGARPWLRAYQPVRRVGRSIFLYDIPCS